MRQPSHYALRFDRFLLLLPQQPRALSALFSLLPDRYNAQTRHNYYWCFCWWGGSVVAIGSSAGGLNAPSQILSALSADFPAAITVVQHVSPYCLIMMADILSRHTQLPVIAAERGDSLRSQTVYIALPDRHLLVNSDGSLSLTYTELVHFVRPSADLLFESVAANFKRQRSQSS